MKQQITLNNGVMNDVENERKVWKGRRPNPEYLATKKCKTCGEIKQLSEFYSNPRTHGKYLHQCKACQIEQMKNHHKTEAGINTLKKALKKYHSTPKGKFVQVKSQHIQRGGGKITMTVDEFAALLENQTECAICGEHFSANNKPVTDHILSIKNEEGKPSPLSVENIQLLCWKCSLIKGNRNLSPEDILKIKISKMEEQNV